MEGSLIHLLMRVVRPEVAASTGIRITGFFHGKAMGGVATIAPFLDGVTSLAKGRAYLLRYAKVFPLDAHSFKPYGMTALLKLHQLLGMAFPTFFREDHRLLLGGCLMVDVAGDAMDSVLCMLRFHPGLKKSGCPLLMARDAESDINGFVFFLGDTSTRGDGETQENQRQQFQTLLHCHPPKTGWSSPAAIFKKFVTKQYSAPSQRGMWRREPNKT